MYAEDEEKIVKDAEWFIKGKKAELIKRFADTNEYESVDHPISLFMAGSPGAGKTEVSKRLIRRFATKPVRIDADEIRNLFSSIGYTGTNAHLFQPACTIGVNKLFDHVIDAHLNAVLDGTFSYSGALKNIDRSLRHKRKVEIYYLYQDPIIAWEFTKKREVVEGRRISSETFIKGFLLSRENVNNAKRAFGDQVELNVIIKNFTTGLERFELNVGNIDPYLDKIYTEEELRKLIK